ncbi:lytic transglycosylase domain-containing protein [Variovorax sp. E3]|uniref:lytic transglycosylase domain-containing protein n=1 Tax=Variovorax sp. E3 TaxID=1914993 RepID=UPI0018DBC847|nr:lytic transglycosylase domain-containing protein [Variovorax sp. E3]
MVDTIALLEQCAPQVAPALMGALVRRESAWRPLAIGMDGEQEPVRQPRTLTEAVEQARSLSSKGRGFSVGLAQIHVSNVTRHGLTWEQAFDPCLNLRSGQQILLDFHRRARVAGYAGPQAVHAALRGYNAGDIDRRAADVYARRILQAAADPSSRPAVNMDKATDLARAPGSDLAQRAKDVRLGAGASMAAAPADEAREIFAKEPAVRGF